MTTKKYTVVLYIPFIYYGIEATTTMEAEMKAMEKCREELPELSPSEVTISLDEITEED